MDISKQLDYYTDSKYLRFIKLSVIHQKLRAREKLPVFQKRGDTPSKSQRNLMKITPSSSA